MKIPKIHQLNTDPASCKQEGPEVAAFYSKSIGMWCEFEKYAKMPHCTFGKCEFGVGDKVVKVVDEDKIHQFLIGLNDDFFSAI